MLLPAVRRAAHDALIVADGFSCRQQIEQGTNRRALHLAEVLHLGMHGHEQYLERGAFAETGYLECNRLSRSRRFAGAWLLAGGGLALAWPGMKWWKRHRRFRMRREVCHGFSTVP